MARTRTPRAPLVPPRREAPAETSAGSSPSRPTPYRRENAPREPAGGAPGAVDDASATTALPAVTPSPAGAAPARGDERPPVRAADPASSGTGPAELSRPAEPSSRSGTPDRARSRRRGLLPPPGAVTRAEPAASTAGPGAPGASGASGASGVEDTVQTRPRTGADPRGGTDAQHGTEPRTAAGARTGAETRNGTDARAGTEPRAGAHRTATPTSLPTSPRTGTPATSTTPVQGPVNGAKGRNGARGAVSATTPVGPSAVTRTAPVTGSSALPTRSTPPGAPAPSRPSPATSAIPPVPPAASVPTPAPDPQRSPVASPRPAPTGSGPALPAGFDGPAPPGAPRPDRTAAPAPTTAPAAAPIPAATPEPVPSGSDRNGPLAEIGATLRRRRAPVTGAVLLAAAGAAGLAVLVPPPAVATTSVQVGSVGTADPGPATARALAAAGSAAFSDRVAQLTGSTVTDVAGRLVLTAPEPGVVAVRATGTDDASATALADDAVTALRERIGALDAAVTTGGTQPLRAEIDRRAADAQATGSSGTTGTDPVAEQLGRTLADRTGQVTVVVDGPAPVVAPGVPTAWWVGGAAGIGAGAALLLAGLGVPAVRRGRGLLPEAHPEDRLRARLDVPVLAPGSAPDAVPRLAGAYRDLLRHVDCLTVVQLTREPACDVASELVKAAALVGDRREYRDLTPGAPATTVAPGAPVVRALRVPRLAHEDLRAVRDGGPSVLVVETAATTTEDVVTAVAALRAVGAPPLLCLVWPGRLPRDPARVPLPADARIRSQHP
jgi:hypothetical protein